MFDRIIIKEWRQFELVDLKFHKELTVLTGANGSGKTTILNLLSRHFGWNIELVSVPKKDEKRGILTYIAGLWSRLRGEREQQPKQQNSIGSITYSEGTAANLLVPDSVSQVYNINIENQAQIKGLHIPSHRSALTYEKVESILKEPRTTGQLISEYFSLTQGRYKGSGGRSPSYSIKEALISFAMFGYGSVAVTPNLALKETFEKFQDILNSILPTEIGFERIEIRMPEVVLVTKTGDFSFDAISGGMASLIDIAWQIYMFSKENEQFVVTIDEPENHLHPKMQRTVLPNLVRIFPNVQFIVATHNPFIVGSVLDSNVYVLTFTEDNRVVSNLLDWKNRAASANDILRDVLGVPVTYPQWVEEQLESIAQRYSEVSLSPESLENLKEDMRKVGLDHLLPQSLDKILREEKGA